MEVSPGLSVFTTQKDKFRAESFSSSSSSFLIIDSSPILMIQPPNGSVRFLVEQIMVWK